MARLQDLPEPIYSHLADLACPGFERTPWVFGPKLSERQGGHHLHCRPAPP